VDAEYFSGRGKEEFVKVSYEEAFRIQHEHRLGRQKTSEIQKTFLQRG
jgi:Txe/YoeB family toxin of Txe-Axe toxin-antitoxin module